MPSSLGSNHQPSSSNASHPPSASIGWNRLGDVDQRRDLRARQEREPIRAGLHEVELQAWVAPAVQHERTPSCVVPLDGLVPAVVEDPDLARAVVALGDRALERAVLERVVFGAHREALVALDRGQALGHRPDSGARRPSPAARRSAVGSPDVCGSRTSSRSRRRRRPARVRGCPRVRSRVAARTRTRRDPSTPPPPPRRSSRVWRAPPCGSGASIAGSGSSSATTPSASRAFVRSIGLRAYPVEQIAEALEAIPHVVDPEVLRLEPALEDLVPRERRRDRRARLGPHRVRRRDVRAATGSCCGR